MLCLSENPSKETLYTCRSLPDRLPPWLWSCQHQQVWARGIPGASFLSGFHSRRGRLYQGRRRRSKWLIPRWAFQSYCQASKASGACRETCLSWDPPATHASLSYWAASGTLSHPGPMAKVWKATLCRATWRRNREQCHEWKQNQSLGKGGEKCWGTYFQTLKSCDIAALSKRKLVYKWMTVT